MNKADVVKWNKCGWWRVGTRPGKEGREELLLDMPKKHFKAIEGLSKSAGVSVQTFATVMIVLANAE